MSKFSKPLGDKSILNPNFKYVPSSKTNIRDTFRRFQSEIAPQNQDSKEPLAPPKGQDLIKPLVLNPEGFVLSVDWFSLEDKD
jgi:hypothetical protein